jgi:kynurenine formamidase
MAADQEWPHHELGRELSNWGRWGTDDEVGTLNLVTAAKRLQAAQLVRCGRAIDLGIAFDKNGPWPHAGFRSNPMHSMTLLPSDFDLPDGMFITDDMIVMPLQAATQWDSLAHVGYDGMFYNAVPANAVSNLKGASRNSFPQVNDRLISRGVLLDIARLKGVDRLPHSYVITPEDLTAAERAQGVVVESGDVLLVRTGHLRHFLDGNAGDFLRDAPGTGLATCRWLRERDVAALAMDNAGCEVGPSEIDGASLPFHQVVIRDMGLTIGEMFNLEALAADCRQDGVWEFLFCGTGLNVTGSVGSPVTPMAIK